MSFRMLDLFCGVGGAGKGLQRAGFFVKGHDIVTPSDYGGDVFENRDALFALRILLNMKANRYPLPYDGVWTSPPCQGYGATAKGNATRKKKVGRQDHPRLIHVIRPMLEELGLPYVIENVAGAPIRRDVMLCGEMFGLRVIRHRYFELGGGWPIVPLEHPEHRGRVAGMRHGEWFEGPYFAVYGQGGGKGTVEQWRDAMGIDWTWNHREIAEAIPPAYSEHLGRALMWKLTTESHSTSDNRST
jgi:DNA (cytosine-5)-methyltransferase 1